MLHVYVNYPVTHIQIHQNPNCNDIRKMKKKNQRTTKINAHTLAKEIDNFLQNKYRFASEQSKNDMWLEVDFEGDTEFETSTVTYLHAILKKHYKPFRDIEVATCC